MAKLAIARGATSVSVVIFISDSASTTGQGLAGLAYNTGSLVCYAVVPGASAAAITLATLAAANSSWSSGGFKEIDATNLKGVYRFDIPNTHLSSGRSVLFMFSGASGMAPCPFEIELTGVNNQSATAFITGVNSLAPPSAWNLLSIDGNGRVDVIKVAGTTQTARDLGASVLLSSGTGTGQVKLSSGYVAPNWGDVGNPTSTLDLTGTTTKGNVTKVFGLPILGGSGTLADPFRFV